MRILRRKSVEEFKPDPYIATVLNCLFWILYGLPIVHPDSTLVVTINGIGLAIEVGYLIIFFIYTNGKGRVSFYIYCAYHFTRNIWIASSASLFVFPSQPKLAIFVPHVQHGIWLLGGFHEIWAVRLAHNLCNSNLLI